MKLLLTLLLSLFVSKSIAQQNQVDLSGDNLNVNLFTDNYKDKIKGSPYVKGEFQLAFFEHDKKNYLVRYNAYSEVMQVKLQKEKIVNLSPLSKYKITISGEDKKYIMLQYPDRIKAFGVLLWSNESGKRLIKREKIKKNAAKEEKAYQNATPASFTKIYETYYFEDTDQKTLVELPKNKNKLFEKIFDEEFKIKAKKEKLGNKTEGDLIKLFKIYFEK